METPNPIGGYPKVSRILYNTPPIPPGMKIRSRRTEIPTDTSGLITWNRDRQETRECLQEIRGLQTSSDETIALIDSIAVVTTETWPSIRGSVLMPQGFSLFESLKAWTVQPLRTGADPVPIFQCCPQAYVSMERGDLETFVLSICYATLEEEEWKAARRRRNPTGQELSCGEHTVFSESTCRVAAVAWFLAHGQVESLAKYSDSLGRGCVNSALANEELIDKLGIGNIYDQITCLVDIIQDYRFKTVFRDVDLPNLEDVLRKGMVPFGGSAARPSGWEEGAKLLHIDVAEPSSGSGKAGPTDAVSKKRRDVAQKTDEDLEGEIREDRDSQALFGLKEELRGAVQEKLSYQNEVERIDDQFLACNFNAMKINSETLKRETKECEADRDDRVEPFPAHLRKLSCSCPPCLSALKTVEPFKRSQWMPHRVRNNVTEQVETVEKQFESLSPKAISGIADMLQFAVGMEAEVDDVLYGADTVVGTRKLSRAAFAAAAVLKDKDIFMAYNTKNDQNERRVVGLQLIGIPNPKLQCQVEIPVEPSKALTARQLALNSIDFRVILFGVRAFRSAPIHGGDVGPQWTEIEGLLAGTLWECLGLSHKCNMTMTGDGEAITSLLMSGAAELSLVKTGVKYFDDYCNKYGVRTKHAKWDEPVLGEPISVHDLPDMED